MEEQLIACKVCGAMPKEPAVFIDRSCRLCGALACDECLNEAGYCTPCSARAPYNRVEANPI
jgi:hypothetical protein